MSDLLYTKDGHPLRVSEDKVFAKSGEQVGRIVDGKVYGPDGRYTATVVGDRVVYRAVDGWRTSRPFAPGRALPLTAIKQIRSSILGEEPFAGA